MKKAILPFVVVIVLIAGYFYLLLKQPTPTVVEQRTVTQEIEIEVDMLSELVADALNASSTEHMRIAQEAYDARLEQLRKEKELEVLEAYQAELDERQETLEKEVGVY